jgi:hypothetical protein
MDQSDVLATQDAAELTAWLHSMWTHHCPTERALLSVGQGEACNWCGGVEKVGA